MNASNRSSKRIIITGGGGRLGSRVVRHFASIGAHVAAVVVSESESNRVPSEAGARVLVKLADVISEASVSEVFRDIVAEFGAVDALIHTIGMWSGGPLLETGQDSWDQMLRVNLTSTFICFREAARWMEGGGTLIALSSRQGADAGVAQQAAYSASKAGVVRLVEAAAAEFGARGISAHAIAPSTILFDEDGEGVQADDLVSAIDYLVTSGSALNGATVRAYGTG